MPVVKSNYTPPFIFRNGHVATIYSGLARKVDHTYQKRQRFELSDGDFIDLDWSYANKPTKKLVVLLHGLEGDAQRPYILGSAKIFNTNNYDCVSVNFRGCSGDDNALYRSYHSGETQDVYELLGYLAAQTDYSSIFIKGFSLGGNVTLKLLGERDYLPNQLKAAMSISVPCDLYGSCIELHKLKNRPYANMFKRHLINRLRRKQKQFPDKVSLKVIKSIKTLKDFDDVYTSKAHGFEDAMDYYNKCSSKQFLNRISIPTLILNAKNDSFLSPSCFPLEEAANNHNIVLEIPEYGGHVGFYKRGPYYYDDIRGLEFFNQY